MGEVERQEEERQGEERNLSLVSTCTFLPVHSSPSRFCHRDH